MHKQLEDYLSEVAKGLGSLPTARRQEELSEISQHLLSTVAAGKETGRTEDEAVQIAVEQFGTAEAVSRQIASAWQREIRLDAFEVLGIAVATPMMLGSLVYSLTLSCPMIDPIVDWLCRLNNAFLLHHMAVTNALLQSLFSLPYGLTGTIVGLAAPKQAVRGVFIGMALYGCSWLAWAGIRPFPTEPRQYLSYAVGLAWALTAVFCAWAVSRWRRTRGESKRGATRASHN